RSGPRAKASRPTSLGSGPLGLVSLFRIVRPAARRFGGFTLAVDEVPPDDHLFDHRASLHNHLVVVARRIPDAARLGPSALAIYGMLRHRPAIITSVGGLLFG